MFPQEEFDDLQANESGSSDDEAEGQGPVNRFLHGAPSESQSVGTSK